MHALVLRQLTKVYKNGIQALKAIDLTVDEGDFFALDASTGRALWHFQTGAMIVANPVSYLSGGKQQVAIASGNSIFAFALDN